MIAGYFITCVPFLDLCLWVSMSSIMLTFMVMCKVWGTKVRMPSKRCMIRLELVLHLNLLSWSSKGKDFMYVRIVGDLSSFYKRKWIHVSKGNHQGYKYVNERSEIVKYVSVPSFEFHLWFLFQLCFGICIRGGLVSFN